MKEANEVREATNPLHQQKVNFSFDSWVDERIKRYYNSMLKVISWYKLNHKWKTTWIWWKLAGMIGDEFMKWDDFWLSEPIIHEVWMNQMEWVKPMRSQLERLLLCGVMNEANNKANWRSSNGSSLSLWNGMEEREEESRSLHWRVSLFKLRDYGLCVKWPAPNPFFLFHSTLACFL